MNVPEGYKPLAEPVGFDQAFGQVYVKREEDVSLGFRIEARHLNFDGVLHGGALAVFADWQCMAPKIKEGISGHTPTISLSMDYLAPAREGQWIEARVKLDKRTGRMLFTSTEFYADGEIVARSKAIYKLTDTPGYSID